MFPDPSRLLQDLWPGGADFRHNPYKKLTLVGHSEGGVVIRLALRELERSTLHDPPKCDLVLFAPAIGGVNIPGWRGFAEGVLGWLFHWSGAYSDLTGDSPLLANLRAETQRLAAEESPADPQSPWRSLNIWAERDGVVIRDNYSCDLYKDYPGTDHVTVCKPTKLRPLPLEIVKGTVHAD